MGDNATFDPTMGYIMGTLGSIDVTMDMVNDLTYDPNTFAYDNMLKDYSNQQISGDISNLLAQSRSLGTIDFGDNFKDNLGYLDSGNMVKKILSGAGKGAGAGAAVGSAINLGIGTLIGGAIGGVVGAGTSLVGALDINRKAGREAKKLESQARMVEQQRINKLNSAADTINTTNAWFAKKNAMNNAFDTGGNLSTNGSVFDTNGFNSVDAGGSHEANPYNGVQMGIAPDGLPNLVEQGEKIVNINGDKYVFSKRFKVKNAEKYNLPKEVNGKTYAEASEYLYKKSGMEDSPNNPVNIEGNNVMQERLMNSQEDYNMKKQQREAAREVENMNDEEKMNLLYNMQQQQEMPMYAGGGSIYIKPENRGKFNATKARTGKTTEELTHSKNPLTRKRAIFAQNAARWSHKHEFGGPVSANYNTFFLDEPYLDTSSKYYGYEFLEPDKKSPLQSNVSKPIWMIDNQIPIKLIPNAIDGINNSIDKAHGNEFGNLSEGDIDLLINTKRDLNNAKIPLQTATRYAPAIQSGLNVLGDMFGITNKPDYSNVELLERSIRQPRMLGYSPVGRYISYNPIDENYILNRQAQIGNSTLNAIRNLAAGNRAQSLSQLAAAAYNTQLAQGEQSLKTRTANMAERSNVLKHNNELDLNNAQRADAIAKYNQAEQQAYDNMLLNTRAKEAQMREAILSASEAAKNSNWNTFAQNLGLIGNENMQWNWMYDLLASGALKDYNKKD